jgi:transcriptional regulator with XRE-family HTH domain
VAAKRKDAKKMNSISNILVKEYDSNANDEIGIRIQKKRIERNITGADLGVYIGVSANQVSRIETGKVKCKLEHIFVLCQVLECSADYLLFGTNEKDCLSDEQIKCIMDIKKYF